MLNTSQRANRVLPETSENANEKSVTEVEGALREFARDVGPMRRDPKDATDFVANVDLLQFEANLNRRWLTESKPSNKNSARQAAWGLPWWPYVALSSLSRATRSTNSSS
jgi:hypothetical protein